MKNSRLMTCLMAILALSACFAVSCRHRSRGDMPNVLFITVDTMRKDYLGLFGKVRVETPIMNRLAESGVLFENVAVSTPLTRISHSSMFTGMYPPQHGVRDNVFDRLPDDAVTMAELFKKEGYQTGAVISGFPIARGSGLNQGFDYYDDTLTDEHYMDRLTGKATSLPDAKAIQVTGRAIDWLRNAAASESPWFFWAHYYDPHMPYNPPSPFDALYKNNLYAGEVAYVDVNLGILLSEIKRLGEIDNTLVVLTSDHGEGLGERQERTHGWQVYNNTTQVFAIFSHPGALPGGKRVTRQVRNLDLFATVMDLAGLDKPEDIASKSLRGLFASGKQENGAAHEWPPAYTEAMTFLRQMRWYPVFSLRDGRYHYIEMKEPELYDMMSDPKEENNLAQVNVREVKKLKAELEKLRKEFAEGPSLKPEESKLTEEERKRFRALGYITDGGNLDGGPGPNAKKLDIEQVRGLMRMAIKASELQDEAEYEKAAQLYKMIIEKNPDVVQPYYNLGKITYWRGDYKKALDYYKKFVARASVSAKARGLTEQGVTLMAMGEPLEAESALKDALKFDGSLPLAYMNLGMAYGQQNLLPEAEEQFEKAIELDPRFAMAYYGLGSVYSLDPKRQFAAMGKFNEALKYDPDMALAHLSMGLLYARNVKLRDITKAEFHLRKALELQPDIEKADLANLYLGLIYFQQPGLMNVEKAEIHLKKALKINEKVEKNYMARKILAEIAEKNEKK